MKFKLCKLKLIVQISTNLLDAYVFILVHNSHQSQQLQQQQQQQLYCANNNKKITNNTNHVKAFTQLFFIECLTACKWILDRNTLKCNHMHAMAYNINVLCIHLCVWAPFVHTKSVSVNVFSCLEIFYTEIV